MASTNVALNVRGVDKTGGVFRSIARNAKFIFAGIAVGAAAAVGKAIKDLGRLSDVAMRASTTADQIMKVSSALENLGINGAAPEMIAQSFQYMTRATGRTGMEGFKKTIEDISKLPTIAERSAAAMQVFGRGGMRYMAVIEDAAKNGVAAFSEFADIQPALAAKSADAGDKAADAWNTVWNGAKSIFYDFVGSVCEKFDKQFAGGIRQAAYVAYAHLRNFYEKAKALFSYLGEYITNVFKGVGSGMFNTLKSVIGFWKDSIASIWSGESLGDIATKYGEAIIGAWDDYMNAVPEGLESRFDAIDAKTQDYLKKVDDYFKKHSGNLDNPSGDEGGGVGMNDRRANFKSAAESSNKWINGGSYEAATFALRAQMRKDDPQTKELKGIKGLIEKMLKNQEGATPVGTLDYNGAS